MKKVTLKQLAQELNLSVSTVSRALSDDYQISPETKQLIRDHAEKRDYKVNLYAKSLREGKTRTIGVVVCSMRKAFMNQIINAMYDYWHEKGYQLLVLQSRGDYATEQKCIKRLLDMGIDGLLISPSFDGANVAYLNELISKRLPIVVFDRVDSKLKTTQVTSNNFLGGQIAAEHLEGRSFTKVLVIGIKDAWLSGERIKGFSAYMDAKDINNYHSLYIELSSGEQSLKQVIDIFSHEIQIDNYSSIFTTTDTLTLTVIRALKRLGLNVPVLGFCNSELSDIIYGELISIVQPSDAIGKLASEKLFETIKKDIMPEEEMILLDTKILEN